MAPGGPRRPRGSRRRRRGPWWRRLARGLGQRVLAARLPGPPVPPGHRRRPRLGVQEARRPGQGPGGARPGGHGRAGQDRRGGLRPRPGGHALHGGRGRPGWSRQRAFPVQPAPRPRLRRAGREGAGVLAGHGAQAHGRRRAGRLPQRRQVDPDLDGVGGQAEDRRLPVHHAGAASRCGACRWRPRRHRLRHGGHPWAGGGCGRGQGPRASIPAPH